MDALTVALSAAMGALTLGILGWLTSKEPFDFKKFVGTFLTAIISGIGVAVTYDYGQGITVISLMTAFLTGVGADAGRKAIADITRKN
jgi:hypothetical protein